MLHHWKLFCKSCTTQNLVSKLPASANIFTEFKAAYYYDKNAVSKDLNFQLLETSPEKILSILKSLNPFMTAGIDNVSGKFLEDGAVILRHQYLQFFYQTQLLSKKLLNC